MNPSLGLCATNPRLTAQALFIESECVPANSLTLIEDARLQTVSPEVCIWLCMLISVLAPDDRLRQSVNALAANRKRRIFVILFYLFVPEQQSEALQAEIADLLPDKVASHLDRFNDFGAGDDLSVLDDLGDVRSVEHIKSRLRIWFKKKTKPKKRRKRKV